ncbi:polymorphic toxin-type HINT domain-containing protein [Zooshikella ganghwensis]|uniref:polymorphic toxin-type HINT domain-containing protein n=1 Tax=Zooshikella ganghwensis TaxID=202772 RepID=UPI0013FE2409|nr:polymorphic toxin-type HINT domain-containing protein [Zooshikella ganghwensis]
MTYDFTYDDQHRLETVTDSRAKKWLKYAYTLGGQLIETRDSDQNQLQYAYDAVGRLVGMKAPNQAVIKFSYNTQDQLAYKHYANGTHTAYQYNTDGSLKLLETFSNTSGQEKLLNQHAYKYDNEGLVVGVKQKTAQGKQVNRQYKYDGLGRLAEIRNDSTLLEKLSYDPYGNRRQHQTGGQTYYYQQNDLHQVTAIHQGSQEGPLAYQFSYDVNGNLTEKVEGDTTLSLVYDALDQLVQANKSGLPAEHYQYDHSGNRIQKQVGDQVTQYLYNGSQVHATYSGNGNPTGYFLYSGLDQPEMFLLGDNVQYYHADALGSITTLTDAQGKTSASQVYNSWGAINSKLSSGSIPLYGYTGREPDATGLIYYRARYYDPDTARFTQLDPKGFIDGVNRYTYALNSPMMFIDPWGTSAMKGANGVWGGAWLGGNNWSYSGGRAPTPEEAASDVGSMIDGLPFAGTGKSIIDFWRGKDSVTGESASRLAIAGGLALGAIPFAKTLSNKISSGISNLAQKFTKGCCCFAPGTPVLTADGKQAIETVEKGQLVYAKNPETGEIALKPVTDRILTEGKPLYTLILKSTTGDADTIEVTNNHPFWVTGTGWVDSAKLKPGMQVEAFEGQSLEVVSLELTGRTEDTYNITVADFHTYYAGEQLAFVHNCTKCGPYSKRRPHTRKTTKTNAWDNAADGSKPNSKSCPDCGGDVFGNPHLGELRNKPDGWDVEHVTKWETIRRDLQKKGASAKEYRDAYNDLENTILRCRACNRRDNQL